MFTVTVRDHLMIAHSLRGEVFGPAQRLHGATYVVDASFEGESLDADGIVVDIGRATTSVHAILEAITYRNLDDDATFTGHNTTTEFLARHVFDRLVAAIRRGELGDNGRAIESVRVTLHESHIASGAYDGRVIDAIAPA